MALSRLERAQVWLFKTLMGALFLLFRVFSPRDASLPGKKLPPVRNPLLLVSATQLAKKIRRKEVCIRPEAAEAAAGSHCHTVRGHILSGLLFIWKSHKHFFF